jgi:hypothetical protein
MAEVRPSQALRGFGVAPLSPRVSPTMGLGRMGFGGGAVGLLAMPIV